MKNIACAAIFVLFLIGLATPRSTQAQTGGPSSSGSYRFVLEDDFSKYVEFTARLDERGDTTGQMTFRDEAGASDKDAEGGQAGDPRAEFYMTASLDSLTIENNRAAMGGTITASSNRGYIGKWVQLVVEDNGDGREVADKLSWCFCQPEEGGWVPADAEVRGDEGAWWSWWATDAERRDDAGVQSASVIPGNKRGCQKFPLAVYAFPDMRSGEGQIQVQP
jgi:hypothetical protein